MKKTMLFVGVLTVLMASRTFWEQSVAMKPMGSVSHKHAAAHYKPRNVLPPVQPLAKNVGAEFSTYVFAGKAIHAGQACPDTDIHVWLNSSLSAQDKTVRTDSEGNYSVSFIVKSLPNEPIYWELAAFNTSYKQVKLQGQRIAMSEDAGAVTVANSLCLLTSETPS